MATIQIRLRIDLKLKKKSYAVLKRLGLDTGSFLSRALTQLVNRRGLPFEVTEPDTAYFARGRIRAFTRAMHQGGGPSHGQQ